MKNKRDQDERLNWDKRAGAFSYLSLAQDLVLAFSHMHCNHLYGKIIFEIICMGVGEFGARQNPVTCRRV